MRRFRRTAATTLAALTFVPVVSADVIFVNDNAPGPFHNGNNWNSAYTDLQDALAEAVAGDQIWVAGGTYRPTSGTNRSISFNLKTGVKLYGGFVPGATVVDDRDPATNLTILSGEIGGVGIGDNSAHVVRAAGVTASGVLDGFVITRGNANIVSPGNPDRFGGGMKLINGGPTIRNCHIVDNVADFAGGGADIVQSEATFIDCLFSDNAAGSGAGADADNGAPSFWNCRFIGNTADSSGGAIRLLNCTGLLVNCEIKGNVCLSPLTGTKGGGVFVTGGTATIVNSTIIANTAAGGGGLGFTGATATLRNSIIYHNTGTVVGGHLAQIQATSSTLQVNACCIEDLDGSLGGSGNFGDDPLLDPLNSGGAFSLGIARIRAGSPCIDAGGAFLPLDLADLDDDGVIFEPLPIDLAGNPRVADDPLVGPAGLVPDVGAIEFARAGLFRLVDADATGAGTGLTWADAYTDLQDALADLNDPKFGGPGEIWVAEGTYVPTTGTDRTISFDLVARARVFGGFDGTEVALAQRDPVAHPTILSGEIGLAGAIDNSQHVVRADESFIDRDSILDGFIITAGNMSSVAGTGGGVFITNGAKPTIANCRIVGNNAFAAGGGVRVEGNASPLIMNCAILGNTARNAAGLDVVNAAATVINPLIAHNASSLVSPGGVRWTNATGTLANGVIVGNTSNGLVGQAAQITVASSTLNITHNDIEDLDGSIGDATNFDEDPAFLNLPGTDGVVGTVDDDLRLTDCSPLIEKGSIVALPLDLADLDEDFDTTERYSIDITNGARIINDPSHAGVSVDVGPLEHPGSPLPDPDLNDDGIVGPPDLAILLSAWDTDGCHPADLNGDGTVGPADLALLLAAWTVNP